jgi:hypothetical protein
VVDEMRLVLQSHSRINGGGDELPDAVIKPTAAQTGTAIEPKPGS